MTNHSEAERIEKYFSIALSIVFITTIGVAFRDTIQSIISYFLILPLWWFIIALTLFSFAIIYTLDVQRRQIQQLRTQIQDEEFEIMQLEKIINK